MFPLITAAAMLFFGRKLTQTVINALCVGSVFISFIFSAGSFLQLLSLPQDDRIAINVLFEWLPAVPFHMLDGRLANFVADWGFQLDPLSAVMILVVTGIGALIHKCGQPTEHDRDELLDARIYRPRPCPIS